MVPRSLWWLLILFSPLKTKTKGKTRRPIIDPPNKAAPLPREGLSLADLPSSTEALSPPLITRTAGNPR